MATENDVIIPNPTPTPVPGPAPAPTPVPPAPEPAPAPTPPTPVDPKGVTPESLRADFALAIKAVRGVSIFLPASVKVSVDRFLVIAEAAETQPWIFDVAVAVLNRFSGQDLAKVPQEQLTQAVFEVFVAKGEQAKSQG